MERTLLFVVTLMVMLSSSAGFASAAHFLSTSEPPTVQCSADKQINE